MYKTKRKPLPSPEGFYSELRMLCQKHDISMAKAQMIDVAEYFDKFGDTECFGPSGMPPNPPDMILNMVDSDLTWFLTGQAYGAAATALEVFLGEFDIDYELGWLSCYLLIWKSDKSFGP